MLPSSVNDPKTLRSFGLLVGGILLGLGVWARVTNRPVAPYLMGIGGVLCVGGWAAPKALSVPYRFWMAVGSALGWFNTRLVLGLAFFLLFTPVGIFRRLFGIDPLQRRWDRKRESYREPTDGSRPVKMERQF